MKIFLRSQLLMIILLLLTTIACAQTQPVALLVNLKSAVSPAVQDYIHRAFAQATKQSAAIIILQIDTPGGLEKTMRGIVSDILASPIPVVAYVAPSGARAASAGTYILYASHIAAMAPGTNLGAATPVSIGMPGGEDKNKSTLEIKAKNDAMAYIRSLAQLRHRNVQWAEQAVSQGVSLSANEALKLNVIDVVANNIPDLLTKINGRNIVIQGKSQTLNTTNAKVQEYNSDLLTQFLMVITDPNVAYILLMIGIWGLFFEFVNPGFMLPGVVGAICLLLALYAFQLLPINYAGLGLILLGIAFLVAEAFIASFGVLGIGGVIALVIGSFMLLHTDATGFQIALPIILAACGLTAIFFLTVINLALKARFKPVVSGREELIGAAGTVIIDEKGYTRMRVLGELWQVRSSTPLVAGQKVKVVGVEGLVLIVEPL